MRITRKRMKIMMEKMKYNEKNNEEKNGNE